VREGWKVNAKKVYRLYKEEGLQLRNKTPKRKVSAKRREAPVTATQPNEVWAMDFVSDQLFDGRRIRILTIVDTFTKLSPAVSVRRSYKGSDVVNTLELVRKGYGIPKEIRVDNGPEFISKDLDLWAYINDVTLEFSRPGKPTDNAFIESFKEALHNCPLASLLQKKSNPSVQEARVSLDFFCAPCQRTILQHLLKIELISVSLAFQ
jgi:putative transposase